MIRYCICAFVLLIASCKKEENRSMPQLNGTIYVINEGNFNFGNGEISLYNENTNQVTNDLFRTVNQYLLGDVVQSMYVRDTLGFIVVNNSAKIEVVSLPVFKKIKTINISGASPRYVLPINDSIAYVSELYAKKIWVINWQTGVVRSTIATQSWTEKMVKIGDFVFVQQKKYYNTTSSLSGVLKIDTRSNTIVGQTSAAAVDVTGVTVDNLDRIWISTDEDSTNASHAGLYCFDQNLVQQKALAFLSYGHHPSNLCATTSGSSILYVDKDIFSLGCNQSSLPATPIISCGNKNVYSMAVNPYSNDIYFSNAFDFVQQSKIYRYDSLGNFNHSFDAGIISGNFSFVK